MVYKIQVKKAVSGSQRSFISGLRFNSRSSAQKFLRTAMKNSKGGFRGRVIKL